MLPLAAAVPPSAFASFAAAQQLRSPLTPQPSLSSLLQSPHFQSLIQSQVAALQSQQLLSAAAAAAHLESSSGAAAKSPRTPTTALAPQRKRVGGSTMKTAKVWRFFDELPTPEQAAECRLCRKKIKATNSSTTGMIRHLRSCHVTEYQQVQEARASSMLLKMEEKSKVIEKPKKPEEAQKSPSASSSASDTASSTASSSFAPLPPLPPLILPQGIPAPKPVLPQQIVLKQEITEVEDGGCDQPADLSCKASAFSSISIGGGKPEERSQEDDEAKKLNAQIALMILMDQLNPQLVDRPGFRQLIRFLRPGHNLPFSSTFQQELLPEIMAQLRHFSALIMLNNPVGNPFEALGAAAMQPAQQQMLQQQQHQRNDDTDSNKSLNIKVEDDSDSASSADSESSLTLHVSRLADYFGSSVKQEDLFSLSSICRAVLTYFEQRPQLLTQLGLSLHPSLPGEPSLLRDLRFVATNSEAINAYIRATPDMELLPISDSQARLLNDLLCHRR